MRKGKKKGIIYKIVDDVGKIIKSYPLGLTLKDNLGLSKVYNIKIISNYPIMFVADDIQPDNKYISFKNQEGVKQCNQ